MAPWAQIAKPFCIHFTVNLFKTVIGAGLVGYGVALALLPLEDGDSDQNDASGRIESKAVAKADSEDETTRFIRKCVTVTTTIGFGLFLSLPSLASQTVWETLIPGITATDIAYDVGAENVIRMIPKWNIKKPKLSSLVPSKEQLVGGLMGEGEGSILE
eukprot:CAMPEP_0116142952 /NCGR_PEP_ID=MMETSP0329-20121206/15185_1 /TAXON_ID=697910 /ORGANISM="Pseudo-nitzschia arenysensis, Strain B593" /LENGTH=158 /DNA_ID=CAMNT_0003638227 /DNA_START=88 /DNA_END=561 /DNA_ORIENTATION=-